MSRALSRPICCVSSVALKSPCKAGRQQIVAEPSCARPRSCTCESENKASNVNCHCVGSTESWELCSCAGEAPGPPHGFFQSVRPPSRAPVQMCGACPSHREAKESQSWHIRDGRKEPAKDILEQLTGGAEIRERTTGAG